jgi:hypothetical protein
MGVNRLRFRARLPICIIRAMIRLPENPVRGSHSAHFYGPASLTSLIRME